MDSDQADDRNMQWEVLIRPAEGSGRELFSQVIELPSTAIAAELLEWWMEVTLRDIEATLPKATEYGGVQGQEGSADLIVMGDAQAELMGHHDMPSAWKQGLACWFYLLGKVARMVSNFKRREWPKPDTVHDARVYLMMIERLGDQGRWP